jgi:hypothetical protein
MADYEPVATGIVSQQRSQLIINVAVGDQIDIVGILGRPARGCTFFTSSGTDSISFKLNSLRRLVKKNYRCADETVLVWSGDPAFAAYTGTGLTVQTEDQLEVSSIEIISLTLFSGSTITISVW